MSQFGEFTELIVSLVILIINLAITGFVAWIVYELRELKSSIVKLQIDVAVAITKLEERSARSQTREKSRDIAKAPG